MRVGEEGNENLRIKQNQSVSTVMVRPEGRSILELIDRSELGQSYEQQQIFSKVELKPLAVSASVFVDDSGNLVFGKNVQNQNVSDSKVSPSLDTRLMESKNSQVSKHKESSLTRLLFRSKR